MAETKRSINGMTCEMCVRHVRNALEDLAGVKRVSVDLAGKEATITYDESKVGLEKMKKAVKEAGYKLL